MSNPEKTVEEQFKACPACAESIQKAAKKCRYCGEALERTSSAPVQGSPPSTRPHRARSSGYLVVATIMIVAAAVGAFLWQREARPPASDARATPAPEPVDAQPSRPQDPEVSRKLAAMQFGECSDQEKCFAAYIADQFPGTAWTTRCGNDMSCTYKTWTERGAWGGRIGWVKGSVGSGRGRGKITFTLYFDKLVGRDDGSYRGWTCIDDYSKTSERELSEAGTPCAVLAFCRGYAALEPTRCN